MRAVLQGLRIVSESNQREHWARRSKRANAQKQQVFFELQSRISECPPFPVVITITRVYDRSRGREIDDDNLVGGCKAIRDQLATMLLPEQSQANQSGRRGDDSDDRLCFSYAQRRGDVRGYSVEIEIIPRGA